MFMRTFGVSVCIKYRKPKKYFRNAFYFLEQYLFL